MHAAFIHAHTHTHIYIYIPGVSSLGTAEIWFQFDGRVSGGMIRGFGFKGAGQYVDWGDRTLIGKVGEGKRIGR